jgi:AcrR family transcriptional regulator
LASFATVAVVTDGLRERKKRETRLALSQAAIRLCVERGWDNVTVDDIAAAADVSVRTFRNYFSSKAEAIAASHAERTLRIADGLRARPPAESLWDAVDAAVLAEFDLGPAQPGHAERLAESVKPVLAQPAVHGEVLKATAAAEGELAEAVAERTGTQGLYPRLVAGVIGVGISLALRQWVLDGLRTSAVPYLREAFARIRAGLPVT